MKKLVTLTLILLTVCSYAQIDTIYSKLSGPLGIVHNNNNIYVAEAYQDQISKIDLNNPTDTPLVIASGVGTPNFMDISGSYLYYTSYNSGKISKVNFQSPSMSTTVLSGLQSPKDLLIVGNTLYYTDPYGISKIDITSSSPTPVAVLTGLSGPIGLAYSNNYLYYSEFGANKISKIGTSSTTPSVVANGLSGPYGGMAFNGNLLYFFEQSTKKLSYIDVTISSPPVSNLASNVNGGDMVFVGVHLYISDFMKSCVVRFSNVTSIKENYLDENILVYPNPANDFITIKTNKNLVAFKIYNAQGTIVKSVEKPTTNKIDLLGLASGMYFIQFENRTSTRFVIQ